MSTDDQAGPPELDEETLEFAHRMFDLARAGDDQLADYVRAGLPANLTDPTGNTLLMLAVYHEHTELAAALLDLGADPNRVNDRGQTPLAAAAFRGSAEAFRLLLAAGADPDAGSPSAADTARFFQRADLVALLRRP